MYTINEMVWEIKDREKKELTEVVRNHGKAVAGGFVYDFTKTEPVIIAGYVCDDPCDICVTKIFVSDDGTVSLEGCDKNDSYYKFKDVDVSDIFAGHLSFLTEEICAHEDE